MNHRSERIPMRRQWQRRAGKFFIIGIVVFAVLSTAVMFLWNGLVPDIFHGPGISFWQAAGLLLLSHILLRGWSPGRHGGWRHEQWRKRMEERLASMTPEEREKFKERWEHRCGPEKA
jgi:hypothetical protein